MDDLLFEDLTQYAASPYHQDMQTRQQKATSVKISDMINGNSGHPNDQKAGTSWPEPMNSYQYDMGDLYLKLDNLEMKLNQIAHNPVMIDSKDNKIILKQLINKLDKIKKAIITMGDDFDKLLD
ncbi:hypothetical protein H8E06_00660 [bacterium]|nr:hypothetical protein [bacterium]